MAEENANNSGVVPPKAAPFGIATGTAAKPAPAAAHAPTLKLKPIIRKPGTVTLNKPLIRKPGTIAAPKPAAPAAPVAATDAPPAPTPAPAPVASAPEAAKAEPLPMPPPAEPLDTQKMKSMTVNLKLPTENLKSITGPIPAQAILKKTGIVAEGIISPAQAQAAKTKTSRISLESVMGAAPASTPAAPSPMKTIRLRRPGDIKAPVSAPVSATAAPAVAAAPAPASEAVAPVANPTVTQKKTLKLHRPSSLPAKPKLGIAKPAPAAAGEVADLQPVGDIADIPEMPSAGMKPVMAAPGATEVSSGSKLFVTLGLIGSLAALVVLGAVMYFLYTEGVGPMAGPNDMAFMTP